MYAPTKDLQYNYYYGIYGIDTWQKNFQEMNWTIVLLYYRSDQVIAKITRWCDKNFGGDWHTYNGCYFAFKNNNDAVQFKLVWG